MQDGASFEILFEKNRCLFGDDVRKIQAKLIDQPDGTLTWEWCYSEEDNDEQEELIKELAKQGKKQREIAKEVGTSPSTVCRKLKK